MFSRPYFHNNMFAHQYPSKFALAQEQARARAIAQQQAQLRARRAQYLPDEEDSEDDNSYPYAGYTRLSPHDRRYLEAKREQEEAERRRRKEEALRKQMLEEEQMNREREKLSAPSTSQTSSRRVSIQSPSPSSQTTVRSRSESPAHSPTRSDAQPQSNTPPPSQYSEAHHEAAIKIQTSYRIHRSLRTINDLEGKFNELKVTLTLPTILDFEGPEGIITITVPTQNSSSPPISSAFDLSTPKLSYTATNYAIHAYTESLNRFLMKLDGVESWGDSKVRKARKGVVRRIEDEASEVEAYWTRAWVAYRDGTTANAIPAAEDVIMEDESGHEGDGLEADTKTKYDIGDMQMEEQEQQEKEQEQEKELQVQMMFVDPVSEEESSSTHTSLINSSAVTTKLEPIHADENTIDALPQLYHTDGSDSSDSDLDFEDAVAIATPSGLDEDAPPAKIGVVVASDAESNSEHTMSLIGDTIVDGEMAVTEPDTKKLDLNSSLGECVVH